MFSMWCVCVLLVLVYVAASSADDLPWWRNALLYQVYPRSFRDSDGDGIGDIKGVTQGADYLKELGVTAIWLSPIFKSPMVDFGYDISDFRSIDPLFGTMDDYKELAQKLKSLDIKLMLDLVPNHSSEEHDWFQKSIKRVEPYTDYYWWVNGTGADNRSVPNNWKSLFGGSMWEWNEDRKQFYLHQFAKQQPDFDFRNPAVVKEMEDIMKFWMDIGVDGFRVDAAPHLVEDKLLRDEPAIPGTAGNSTYELYHIYTQNQNETFQVFNHFADFIYNYSLTNKRERYFMLEAAVSPDIILKYFGHGKTSFMAPFCFALMGTNQGSRAPDLVKAISDWLTPLTDETSNWVVGNHDNKRVADRFGPEAVDAWNLIPGVLPGVKIVYNGEEIGMTNTFIRWDESQDPAALNAGPQNYQYVTRDPARTPIQWDNSTSAGFSSNNKTWLPVNPNYWWLNINAQRKAENSHLKVFKAMAELRKDPVLIYGTCDVKAPDNDTFVLIRSYNGTRVVLIYNMGSEEKLYTSQNLFSGLGLDVDMTVVTASINTVIKKGSVLQKGSASVRIRPKGVVVLKSIYSPSPSPGSTTLAPAGQQTTVSPPNGTSTPSSASDLTVSLAIIAYLTVFNIFARI